MKKISTLLALMLVMASGVGCAAQRGTATASSLRAARTTHYITGTLRGGTITVGEGSTLVFRGKGKISGATVTGRNITVVPDGDATAFEGCNLSGLNIVNSQLRATNLGLVADMGSKPLTLTLKGKKFATRERTGTDNFTAWHMLAQLLTGSSGVTLTFNGSFYNGHASDGREFVEIKGARNLSISGGTVIMGIRLINCNNVTVSGVRWVGYHEAHDFPPIYTGTMPITLNGVTYSDKTAFWIGKDKLYTLGVAGDAVRIMNTAEGTTCSGFTVNDCHFEMRQNGLFAGERTDKCIVSDVKSDNCTASHIYFQPVALHASGAMITNMTADYCLQGVDISTCSNRCTVTGGRFTRCAFGPKQETMEQFKSMTHGNVIDNCYFQITDDYLLLEGSNYVLNVSEGARNDTFTCSNTTFDVKKDRAVVSVRNRTAKCILKNVTINLDIRLNSRSTDKWSMLDLFSVYGATSVKPMLVLEDVTVNMAAGTKVYDLFFPHCGNVEMNVQATRLKLRGSGIVHTYFDKVTNVSLTDCDLNADVNYVAQGVTSLTATGCSFAGNNKYFFVDDKAGASLSLKNCSLRAATLVHFKENPKLVDLQGNNIAITGTEAFSGVDKASLSAKNFKVQKNTFSRSSARATLMPAKTQSKYSKLLNNNTVR